MPLYAVPNPEEPSSDPLFAEQTPLWGVPAIDEFPDLPVPVDITSPDDLAAIQAAQRDIAMLPPGELNGELEAPELQRIAAFLEALDIGPEPFEG